MASLSWSTSWGIFLTAKLFKVKVNEFSHLHGPGHLEAAAGRDLVLPPVHPSGRILRHGGGGREQRGSPAFGNATWWKRIIILAAGATMNFLTGFLVLVILVGFSAGFQVISQPVVDSVEAGSSLEGYLQPGDRLYRIDGGAGFISPMTSPHF